MIIVALGLINWLVTVLLVESEITRPFREWVNNRYEDSVYAQGKFPEIMDNPPTVKEYGWRPVLWYKARYLVGCQLCSGVWVGLILAALTIGQVAPFGGGALGIVLAGLLYKAIGHTVLIGQKLAESWS